MGKLLLKAKKIVSVMLVFVMMLSTALAVFSEKVDAAVDSYVTLSEGWYYIKNVNSQKYLQVAGNSGYEGANVEQGTGTGVSGQKWYLTNVGNGYFTLKNGTGYMLDVSGGKNEDGTNVHIWTENGGTPQNFKVVRSSAAGCYGILTDASDDTKALDVYDFSTEDGGNVCQWTYYDNTCQQWIFEPVGGSSQPVTPPIVLSPGDIYVAPDGKSSNEGTQNSPMDLVTAISRIQAGNTIWMQDGTYRFSSRVVIDENNNGTAAAYKRISSINNGKVVLNYYGMTEYDSNQGVVLDGSYWHLYGLEICYAGDTGMLVSGDYNIVEMCQFYNNHDTGLQISRFSSKQTQLSQWPKYNKIINCTSFNNKDEETAENADGFAAKLTCGEGNVFDGCIAYCNSDDGWDLYAKPETGSIGVVTIKNCVAFGNGKMTDGTGSANGDMNGFKLGGSSGACPTPHIVENCLAFNNGACGFTDNGNGGAVTLTNCTAANNGQYETKANYMCYRTSSSAKYTNVLSFAEPIKAQDKFLGQMRNSIYVNGGFYHISSSSFPGSAVKEGTKITLTSSDFVSTTIPGYSNGRYATNYHEVFRNADGNIELNGLFEVKGQSGIAKYGTGAYFDYEESATADPLAHFTFDDDTNGFTNGYAIATGNYSLQDHNDGKALYLNGNGQYLDVKKLNGTSLLTSKNEITISFQAKPDTSSTNWLFFAAPDANAQGYQQEHYLGVLDKDGIIQAERFNNNGSRPVSASVEVSADDWNHIAVVYTTTATIIYVNGVEVARQGSGYSLSEILGRNSVLYIGRANWGNGEYYKGLIDNYTIYGRALSAAEVKEVADGYAEVIVDKSALISAIDKAVPDADKDKYTDDSWGLYEVALTKAKEVVEDADASQEEVDSALAQLEKAMSGLTIEEPVKLPYVDVVEADWFYEAAYYTYVEKIITGLDETHFGPHALLSRAQLAMILYRIEKEPSVVTEKTFVDIVGDEWYAKAVLWAAENGIVTGYEQSGCFAPNDNITREQAALMMRRYAKFKGYDVNTTSNLSKFADGNSVSPYATEAMQWAAGTGLITGKENGTRLDPQGSTSRAECATIIQRFMTTVVNAK